MNKINCLITTKQHKDIAQKLGLHPTIVTNLASMFASENHSAPTATESDIKALLDRRKEYASKAYLAIPMYIEPNENKVAAKGKPLAVTHTKDVYNEDGSIKYNAGDIELWKLPQDGGMDYFFDYISGKYDDNETSKQKKVIFDKLIEKGELTSIEELKQLLQSPYEVYQFLLWHEMSHKQNGDAAVYWEQGKDLMTADKLNIEYRATLDALNKAKAYRKEHPIQEEKETTQQNTTPPVGINRVKVDINNPSLKIAAAFTPQQRRDRVNLIARMFADEVTGTLDELLATKEEELNTAIAQGDWALQREIQASIELLNDPVKGRQEAIKYATVEKIVENIQESFKEMLEYADTDYLKQQYQNVLDNFEYLLDQASFKIENDEHLRLALVKRDKFVGKTSEETIGGTVEQAAEDLEGNGREQDDDDEDGNRATGNDGWSFKVRMVDPHNSMSKTTKRILSHLVKLDNVTGNPELDDLGNERYLNEQHAHTVLLNHLSDMVDDSDFCIKETDEEGNISYTFPALEALVGKYKWVQQVIDELTNNPREVSAFYADFRKDFIPYWKTKQVTETIDGKERTVIKSIPLNQATGFESAKNQFIDNYESGTVVDKDSVYSSTRKLSAENIAKGKSLLSDIDLQEVDDEDYDDICEKLAKAVRMLGLPTTTQAIKNVWDTADGDKNITDIYHTLNYIYDTAEKAVGKKNAHLISECETDFNKLSRLLGEVTELDAVGSFRNGDKTYYSYSAPNYLNTQIKMLTSNARRQEYLDNEFKEFSWFYGNGKWKGSTIGKACWLELIETDEDVRDNMHIRELLSIEDNDYVNWSPGQIRERFITEYFSAGYNVGSKKQFGYYNYPIFSDSPVAMLIKMPRYTENFEGEIVPRLRQVVLQELERIKLVEAREKADVSPIACFDDNRGKSFCFFPFLNNWKDEKGKSFRNKVAELKSQGMDAINDFIDEVMYSYMEEECDKFTEKYAEVGQKLIEAEIAENEEDAYDKLREYFYNHHYAETQIIQLTTTDLAFYKDGTDFQKRYKEVYAAGTKLNTQSQYGREFEKTLYLSDQVITSAHYTDIKSALMQAKDKWIADGMDAKAAQMSIDSILNKFKDITVTDAQAYRSLSSFRAVLDMIGLWDDNMQKSFDRIQNGEWDMSDFNTVWQTIKPFVYTQIGKESGVGDTKMKVPHQNKNSEFLLLSMHQMIATSMQKSPQLVALNKFMEQNNIDVVQFESAVKAGKQGCVDITYSEKALQKWIEDNDEQWGEILDASKLDEATDFEFFKDGNDQLLDTGKISQEEYNKRMNALTPTESEVTAILNTLALNADGSINSEVIHTIPYRDYMVAQPTPEHLFDKESMSEAVFGSQFRNLIVSDISDNAEIIVNGKPYKKQELLDLYNSLIVENLLDDYQKVQGRFNSIEDLQKALLNTVRGNAKYGKNILDALQLVDWTDPNTGVTKKVFNIPLYSPSITTQIQEIVDAMFKNAVTKQKIKGAACILVSNFGFTKELNIKYKKDGDRTSGVEYAECYLPWYSKKHFEPFLKEVTKDGVTYQEIDITKIPKDLLEMVGYRIPTEDKYSMIPLRVKGFLPQQNGGTIMLPADITQMAGSDFDVDKLFMMMPAYKIEQYDKPRAIREFKQLNSDDAVNKLLAAIFNSDEALEESAPEDFKTWWNEHKEEYKLDKPIIHKVKYNPTRDASEQSRDARNNMLIDISRGILQNQDTADKLLNPGSFDRLKQAERISTIMSNRDYLQAYALEKGIQVEALFEDFNPDVAEYDSLEELNASYDENNQKKLAEVKAIREALKKETLKTLDKFLKKYKTERDPLSLDTFVYNHRQNMTGGMLIGMYANNTTMQAKFQGSGIRLRVKPADPKRHFKGIDNTFDIDGKRIEALDQVFSAWGERISKNCAEFSAASVDNVKDPVLAGLMQNTETANIAGFMLRAGIPINIIGLMFTQPIIKQCIEETGGLRYSDLKDRLPKVVQGHLSVTTDELMDTIIMQDSTSETAARIGSLMLLIQGCASDMSSITKVSRADSPNGAIDISLGAARNQAQRVTQLLRQAENDTFRIAGLTKALMKNEKIKATDSKETMREKLRSSKMPRLQAFYSLGIELPLQVMSPFFVQLSSKLDEELKKIYEQTPYGALKDEQVEQFYKDYIEYMLTESPLFGNDGQQTFNEKRDYYLYAFPAKFYTAKQTPKFKGDSVIQKIAVTNGDIQMKRSGRLTPEMRESLTTDFDSMIASRDAEVVQMALDLFMYSFYKNGYYFGPNSFGNFFSPFFLQSFPEFMTTLRGIEQQVESMDMSRFISQFYNNYWRDITFELKDKTDFLGRPTIVQAEPTNPNSDIIVPFKDCVNKMTGVLRNPYRYVQYNGDLYYLKTSSKTACTYYKVLTVTDEQGKKYNAAESIQDMAQNTTNPDLISANKKVGAKQPSFAEMEAMFAKMDEMAAMEDQLAAMDDMFAQMEGAMDGYNIDDALAQLDEPLCNK